MYGAVSRHSYVIALMMGAEIVPEILVALNEVTWPAVREDLIKVSHCESITSYIFLCCINR
jgi:hypothetical protein